MVEETAYSSNKPKVSDTKVMDTVLIPKGCKKYIFFFQSRAARPKPVYLWTVQDVQKWLRRHCSEYYPFYAEKFQHVWFLKY